MPDYTVIDSRGSLFVVLDGYHVVGRFHTYAQALLVAWAWDMNKSRRE